MTKTTKGIIAPPIQTTRIAVYGYAANSSEPGPSEALKDQLGRLRQAAIERGWAIVTEYIDSGASGSARPGLDALLGAAGERPLPFDKVVVESMSKLSGSYVLPESYHRALKQAGVDLVVTGCPDNDAGWLMRHVMTLVNESQSRDHSARVKRGIAAARARRAADGTDAAVRQTKVPCKTCNGLGWEKAAVRLNVRNAKVEE